MNDPITPVCVQTHASSPAIDLAVAALDRWFETIRDQHGYGGPVVHWWRQSLLYTGYGFDWRYEGIIDGYVTLWERTQQVHWLKKARRAGQDLLGGQLPDGHYAASSFELNPAAAGTPHEAACDLGLLRLSRALKMAGDADWNVFADAAETNLRAYHLGRLWSADIGAIRDSVTGLAFVPNKAACAAEALFVLAALRGDDQVIHAYALPSLRYLLTHQVQDGWMAGAIAQNSFGKQRVEKYFPIYIARCIPALVYAYQYTHQDQWLESALAALDFIRTLVSSEGELPTVVYPDNQRCRWPSWIAPLGDVIRAADMLNPYGGTLNIRSIEARVLAGQTSGGGIRTADGFASQHDWRQAQSQSAADFRDLLPVAGWCDKAFRVLAARCSAQIPETTISSYQAPCRFQNHQYTFVETSEQLELRSGDNVHYRWCKGDPWAQIHPELWIL